MAALLGIAVSGPRPAVAAGPRADFVVAPRGSDRNPGTLAKPFATLARARDAVRSLRQAQPHREVLVLVRGGTYRLARPLVFTPEDSGRAGGSVTYAAFPGERPVLSGGRVITGFRPAAGDLWQATVPAARDGSGRFEQLFVNGRRAVRARTPNAGYFYVEGTVATGLDPLTGKVGPLSDHAFLAGPQDLARLVALPPDRRQDVVVVAYHTWETSRHRVAAVDAATGMLFLMGTYPPKFFGYAPVERYFLENYREALDAPGEWFLDKEGTLLYKPRPGEKLATAVVTAPATETLIKFQGSSAEQPVANIALRGLAFEQTAYRMPPAGQFSPQAACNIAAAVMADYAQNVKLEDCTIQHTGTYGVWFRAGCRDCTVQRCYLNDLGAGGVRIGQTGTVPDAPDLTSHIRVDNNIIRNGGHIWPDAVGVLIGHSGDNQVTHNDLADLRYTGISAGWRWGYGEVPSVRNNISYNHIHHLGRDVLTDMGGIYTLGEAPGTVLSHNVIHDLETEDGGGLHGLYNDNSSSHIVSENNLVYNCPDGFAYQLTSGRENVLRNNIFVTDKGGQFSLAFFYPQEEHLAITLERNLIYGTAGRLFVGREINSRAAFRNNLYWEPSGVPLSFAGLSLPDWQKLGRDAGSVIADPGFVDPARGDFRLKPNSPALGVGFVPFDASQAGVYGSRAWVAKAGEVSYPPYDHTPQGPPRTFADDFEATPVGAPPARAHVDVEKKGDALEVTAETAATGQHSLKITDAPGLQYQFNPHFFYSPQQARGVTTLAFDIRLEQGASMYCEWRQYPGRPYYYTGPLVHISDGTLKAGDTPLMAVPLGEWFHVEVSAGQGNQADGTWQLTVTLPGAAPRRFTGLKTGNPETKRTTWLGFVSDAAQQAVYYLDNISLTNTEALKE